MSFEDKGKGHKLYIFCSFSFLLIRNKALDGGVGGGRQRGCGHLGIVWELVKNALLYKTGFIFMGSLRKFLVEHFTLKLHGPRPKRGWLWQILSYKERCKPSYEWNSLQFKNQMIDVRHIFSPGFQNALTFSLLSTNKIMPNVDLVRCLFQKNMP